MPCVPFRLLNPAEYALLSAQEKRDYFKRLTTDIRSHLQRFRADNMRLVQWVLHRDRR
jgi:hypothetical protein